MFGGLLGPRRRLLLLADRDVRRVFTEERTDEGADRAHFTKHVEDEVGEALEPEGCCASFVRLRSREPARETSRRLETADRIVPIYRVARDDSVVRRHREKRRERDTGVTVAALGHE